MLLSKRVEFYLRLQSIILIALYCIFILGGYKTFTLWSQIDVLVGLNPFTTLDHPHGLRYLIVSPTLFLAEYYAWDRSTVFSLFVVFNLSLCAVITAYLQSVISKKIENRWIVWLYLFIPIFLTLSFPMNGRLSYMLLGTALMMFSYLNWSLAILRKKPLWQVCIYVLTYSISLALLSVTSGCFMVGVIVAILQSFVLVVLPDKFSHKILHVTLNSLPPILLGFLQYQFVEKNLDYYGGSLLAMLVHGPGKYLGALNPNKYLMGSVIGLGVFILILLNQHAATFIRRNILLINPILLVILSVAIGIFGYSTLLTGSIAAMILVIHISGSLFYVGSSPWVLVRQYLTDHSQHIDLSRARQTMALFWAAIIGGSTTIILPDDWTLYTEAKVEQRLKNSIFYEWDKLVRSDIQGDFIPGALLRTANGDVYVAESGTRILRIDRSGKIETFAGDATKSLKDSTQPDRDGPRLDARFADIVDIQMDKNGNLYVVDRGNNKIKKITADGMVTTIAGNGQIGIFENNCPALECRISSPQAILVMPGNTLMIAESVQLLRLNRNGTVTRIATIINDLGRTEATATKP